jgi:hypothetical protein
MVTIFRNVALDDPATSTQTSSVNEPTVAAAGRQVFITGNWFASRSSTSGNAWTHIDPFTTLPAAAGGFCCDQVALSDPGRQIWLWLLQYIVSGGGNVFRVAVANSSGGPWAWWDFAPTNLNAQWTDMWFDYPDAALSTEHLYITFNAFNAANNWLRAFAFRMPLADLAARGNLGYQWWTTTSHGSLRLTQGATTDMYFASHNGGRVVRVFRWPGGTGNITSFDVTTSAWNAGPYNAAGPGGNNWLARADSRITGAWLVGRQAGFMWMASPQAGRPRPYVKIVVVDVQTRAIVEEPDLWSTVGTWGYPGAGVSSDGRVGISLFYGTSQHHPSHVVGVRSGNSWDTSITATSTHGPTTGTWGDYLSCRPHPARAGSWAASGYTLQGGTGRVNIEPRYVQFGP